MKGKGIRVQILNTHPATEIYQAMCVFSLELRPNAHNLHTLAVIPFPSSRRGPRDPPSGPVVRTNSVPVTGCGCEDHLGACGAETVGAIVRP